MKSHNPLPSDSSKLAVATIKRVTWIGFWVNAVLMVLKLVCGWLGHSDALVADGVHSMSDFATDFIILFLIGIAYKSADTRHPYGHGKYETMASLIIAVILFAVGAGLAIGGVTSIRGYLAGDILPRPDVWTIVVAALSIAGKEALYRYTIYEAKTIDSSSLTANAWHHRSDALSSVATLIGVTAGFFLGIAWRVLDPIATVLISVFIIISAVKIALPSIRELLEIALPQKQINEIITIISRTPGVKAFHHLRTRRNGHTYVVDVHIKVDPDLTVTVAHDIATEVEQRIKNHLGSSVITSVHIEPYHSDASR